MNTRGGKVTYCHGDIALVQPLEEGGPPLVAEEIVGGKGGEGVRRLVLLILARDPALLSRHGLGPENSRFICATPPGTLPPFVEEEGELTAFLREEGEGPRRRNCRSSVR